MRKRAGIYSRVSTKTQERDGFSIPAQFREDRKLCQQHGYKIVIERHDDISGKVLERPGLNEIREMICRREIDVLVVYDPDRLTREPTHSVLLRDELEFYGVSLHYVVGGLIDLSNFGAQAIEDFKARIAKNELDKMRRRSMDGKREKARAGHALGAPRPPYGYEFQNSRLVVVPEMRHVPEMVFQRFCFEGLAIREIARQLSALQIPTHADIYPSNTKKRRGYAEWGGSSVRRILENSAYRGLWYYNKTRRETYINSKGKKASRQISRPQSEWIGIECEAIVSPEVWQLAQDKLEHTRRQWDRHTVHQFLFQARLTCNFCGLPIYGRSTNHKYYACRSALEKDKFPHCGLPL